MMHKGMTHILPNTVGTFHTLASNWSSHVGMTDWDFGIALAHRSGDGTTVIRQPTKGWPLGPEAVRGVFLSTHLVVSRNTYTLVLTLSRVWLFANLWTVACQALLSMGFFRQEYWSGLPFTPPRDLPGSGIEPLSLAFPRVLIHFGKVSIDSQLALWLASPFLAHWIFSMSSTLGWSNFVEKHLCGSSSFYPNSAQL